MFVILCYDVKQVRDARMLKIAKKFLHPVQNSVLEGELTAAQLGRLKQAIAGVIDPTMDSVLIYHMDSLPLITREQLGQCASRCTDRIL